MFGTVIHLIWSVFEYMQQMEEADDIFLKKTFQQVWIRVNRSHNNQVSAKRCRNETKIGEKWCHLFKVLIA